MIKAWIQMWKKTFSFRDTVSRKEYWLALLMNVIAMYIAVIPYSLIAVNFTDNVNALAIGFIAAGLLPFPALFVRRCNALCWRKTTALYVAVTLPVISLLLVGFLPDRVGENARETIYPKLFALGFALFFYGGSYNVLVRQDASADPLLPSASLILFALTLLWWFITHKLLVRTPAQAPRQTPAQTPVEMPPQQIPADATYSYYIANVLEESRWMMVECREEDSMMESRPFIQLVKRVARKWSGGETTGLTEVGELRYQVKNDPLHLVYQWDDLYGIVLEYPNGADVQQIRVALQEYYGIG